MLVTVLCFTACGNESEQAQYDEAELEQVADFLVNYCASADEATLEQWDEMSEFAVDLQLTQAGLPFESESFLSVLDSWQSGVKECGNFIGRDEYSYKETNGKIEVTAPAEFEKVDATITFMFDSDSKLESMTISAKMSTGEILEKAGLNTVLGMGTVFVVLIIIAFIISLFKYIPKIQAAFTKKPAESEKKEVPAPAAPESASVQETATDDTELIAVIAAAIAAAEAERKETSTDGFIVRSIRRRPSNKWNSK